MFKNVPIFEHLHRKNWKLSQCRLAKIGTFSPFGWRAAGVSKGGALARSAPLADFFWSFSCSATRKGHYRTNTGGLKTRPYGKPLCRGGFPTLPQALVHQRRLADRCPKMFRFLNTCTEKIWKLSQCRLAKIGTFSPVGWRGGGWILKEGAFSKRLLKPASLVPFLPEQERNMTAPTFTKTYAFPFDRERVSAFLASPSGVQI